MECDESFDSSNKHTDILHLFIIIISSRCFSRCDLCSPSTLLLNQLLDLLSDLCQSVLLTLLEHLTHLLRHLSDRFTHAQLTNCKHLWLISTQRQSKPAASCRHPPPCQTRCSSGQRWSPPPRPAAAHLWGDTCCCEHQIYTALVNDWPALTVLHEILLQRVHHPLRFLLTARASETIIHRDLRENTQSYNHKISNRSRSSRAVQLDTYRDNTRQNFNS